jgi:hypothetical protein
MPAFQFQGQQRSQWPEWMQNPEPGLIGAFMVPGKEDEGPRQLMVHRSKLEGGQPCMPGDWVVLDDGGLRVSKERPPIDAANEA